MSIASISHTLNRSPYSPLQLGKVSWFCFLSQIMGIFSPLHDSIIKGQTRAAGEAGLTQKSVLPAAAPGVGQTVQRPAQLRVQGMWHPPQSPSQTRSPDWRVTDTLHVAESAACTMGH